MRSTTLARGWHLLTAVVCGFALVLQLILVILGVSVLLPEQRPGLAVRLGRLISYFTIQSNIVVLISTVALARSPVHDGRGWRVLRLDALIGITVTGVVHWFLLRPLLHLTGWPLVADKLLHLAVPIMVVLGWLVLGPRPRITWGTIGRSIIWPVAWIAYALVVGAATGWYPYPFLNAETNGYGPVLLAILGIAVMFVVLAALSLVGDRRLPGGRAPAVPSADAVSPVDPR